MIVVAGEALIDLVPQGVPTDGGPVTELPALAPRLGGGPYNTAVALGRLGSSVAFCSRVSRDAFGEALLGGLRAAGVDVSPVQRGDEPTTLAVASIGADGSAGYSFYVEGTADRLFAVPEALPHGHARGVVRHLLAGARTGRHRVRGRDALGRRAGPVHGARPEHPGPA